MMPVRQANIRQCEAMINDLGRQQPDPVLLIPELRRLAGHGLCVRFHQDQGNEMVRKWTARLRTGFPRGIVEDMTPSVAPTSRSRQSTNTRTSYSSELDEVQSLQDCIAAMQETIQVAQQRLDALQSVTSIETPSATVLRASSAVSSRTVSRSSTLPLTAGSSRTVSRPTTPQPSPAPRAPSVVPVTVTIDQPASRRNVSPPPPVSPGSQNLRILMFTAPDSLTFPPPPTLAIPISTHNPATIHIRPPTAAAIRCCSRAHARRLPYDESCPICYDETPLSDCHSSDLVWCRSGCGRTVHKYCFNAWEESQAHANPPLPPTCTICRALWGEACDCLERCSDVHVRRNQVDGNCSVCQEDLRGEQDARGEWSLPKLLWCKDGCGGNVHEACFGMWKEECVRESGRVTCTNCRAEWVDGCEC
jgi:hypothetical protein